MKSNAPGKPARDAKLARLDFESEHGERFGCWSGADSGGVGVPTLAVGAAIFCGGDATEMMLDFHAAPELVRSGEFERLRSLPIATTNPRGWTSEVEYDDTEAFCASSYPVGGGLPTSGA